MWSTLRFGRFSSMEWTPQSYVLDVVTKRQAVCSLFTDWTMQISNDDVAVGNNNNNNKIGVHWNSKNVLHATRAVTSQRNCRRRSLLLEKNKKGNIVVNQKWPRFPLLWEWTLTLTSIPIVAKMCSNNEHVQAGCLAPTLKVTDRQTDTEGL